MSIKCRHIQRKQMRRQIEHKPVHPCSHAYALAHGPLNAPFPTVWHSAARGGFPQHSALPAESTPHMVLTACSPPPPAPLSVQSWPSVLIVCYPPVGGEGLHKKPPQNVPLWQMDFFELKAIEAQQTKENFYLSHNCLKGFRQGATPRLLSI